MSREALLPLFEWLGHTGLGETIRSSAVLIALIEIIHLIGLTMLAGTVLMVDMAMLGLGIRRHPTARIARELAPWTTAGLVVLLMSGPLILSSETRKCYDSSFFWAKMAVLFAAIVFHFTVHRKVALAEPPAGRLRAGLVASLSLGLWIGVALAGKMIGIYGDDLRKPGTPEPLSIRLLQQPAVDGVELGRMELHLREIRVQRIDQQVFFGGKQNGGDEQRNGSLLDGPAVASLTARIAPGQGIPVFRW